MNSLVSDVFLKAANTFYKILQRGWPSEADGLPKQTAFRSGHLLQSGRHSEADGILKRTPFIERTTFRSRQHLKADSILKRAASRAEDQKGTVYGKGKVV